MAATPGTAVTSKNPATNTNTSLTVTLASTTVGALNVILFFGESAGTAVNMTVTTPSGWTKEKEQFTAAGTPAVTSILFSRVFQSGDASTVAVSWTNAGQAMAVSVPYSGFDTTTPLGTANGANKSGSTGAWTVSGTTSGTGCFTYAMMNRTGIAGGGAAYSAATDNVLANDSVTASSVSGLVEYVTGSTPTGTAFTKTATGPATSIGTYLWWTVNDAAGTFTGTASVAATATITAAGVVGTSAAATLSIAAGTTASGTPASNAALAATATITAAGTVGVFGAATLAATATLTATSTTPAKQWVTSRAGGTQYVAHRDGLWGTYGEETLEGYTAAAAYNTGLALEISLWDTSDGVYVCSHDSTTGRVFSGTNRTINSTTWATFSPGGAFVTTGRPATLVGGNVMRRLEEIVNAFPTRIFVIENKHGTNQSTLVTLLQSLCPGRWIFKGPYNDTANANTSSAAGCPIWLFWYPTDLGNLSTTYTALATAISNGVPIIFGLGDYATAPVPVQSDANTFFTFTAARGIYTWAHILATGAQKTTADGQASTAGTPFDGYMVSNVANVLPSDSGAASLTATATVTAAGVVGESTGAALGATATTAATGAVGTATTAALSGTAAITSAGVKGAASGATLSTTATATASGVVGRATSTALAGTVTITSAGAAGKSSATTLAAGSTITAAGAVGESSTATAPITTTITAAGVIGTTASAILTGTATITAAGTVVAGSASTATLTVTAATAATGAVAASTAAALAATVTTTAAGTVATSGTAARAVTVTITAAGVVGAASSGTAQVAAVVAIHATGVVGGAARDITVTVTIGTDRWAIATGTDRWTVTTGRDRWAVTSQEAP